MRKIKSVSSIVFLLCVFAMVEAVAQQPQPSQIRVVKSDALSWTISVTDPQGVAYVDSFYGYLPKLFKWRDLATACPKTGQFTLLKKRRFFLRTLPFYEAAVIDCSANAGGESVVTHFRITPQGAIRIVGKAHTRSHAEQVLLDRFDLMALDQELVNIKLWIILILLLGLLFLWLWTFWRALGPFLRSRD